MQIHITRNGKRLGPFTEEELTREVVLGNISYNDLAWTEGMADWLPLRNLIADGTEPPPLPTIPEPPGCADKTDEPPCKSKSDFLGNLLIVIPTLAALLILAGVGSPLVFLCVVLLGVPVVWIDARKIGVGGPNDLDSNGKRNMGPAGWAISQLLLWPMCYPAYFFTRMNFASKPKCLLGFAGAFFMIGSMVMGPVSWFSRDASTGPRQANQPASTASPNISIIRPPPRKACP